MEIPVVRNVLEANDLRKAIQLPEEVLMAPGGMEPNPR